MRIRWSRGAAFAAVVLFAVSCVPPPESPPTSTTTTTTPPGCTDPVGGDTIGTALNLGTVVPGDQDTYIVFDGRMCPNDVDWFRVRVREEPSPLPSGGIIARFELFPGALGDLDLHVYDAAGTLVGSSTNSGTAIERVDVQWPDVWGQDDSRDFYARVSLFSGVAPTGDAYQLRISASTP